MGNVPNIVKLKKEGIYLQSSNIISDPEQETAYNATDVVSLW